MSEVMKNYLKNKKEEMERCDHLFCLTGKESGSYIVNCLKCGLTNKYVEMSTGEVNRCALDAKDINECLDMIALNNLLYKREFGIAPITNNRIDAELTVISKKVLNTNRAKRIYDLAKRVNDNDSPIFEVMERLCLLDENIELFDLPDENYFDELIKCYNKLYKNKVKVKTR